MTLPKKRVELWFGRLECLLFEVYDQAWKIQFLNITNYLDDRSDAAVRYELPHDLLLWDSAGGSLTNVVSAAAVASASSRRRRGGRRGRARSAHARGVPVGGLDHPYAAGTHLLYGKFRVYVYTQTLFPVSHHEFSPIKSLSSYRYPGKKVLFICSENCVTWSVSFVLEAPPSAAALSSSLLATGLTYSAPLRPLLSLDPRYMT